MKLIFHFHYISKLFSQNSNDPREITFEKDSNIFVELKLSIKNTNIEDISAELKNMSQRFFYAYKNSAYSALDKIFSKSNTSCFLIYDENRIELFNQIRPNINIDKDIEICYNSFNASISSIVLLQNQIREMDIKLASQEKKLASQEEKLAFQEKK